MRNIIKTVLLISALLSSGIFAEGFEIHKKTGFEFSYNGEPVIIDAWFDFSSHEYRGIVSGKNVRLTGQSENTFKHEANGWRGSVTGGKIFDGVSWCREMTTDGEELELNFAAIVPPYDHGLESFTGRLKLYMPVELLKGSHYTYRLGRHRSGKKRSGTLKGNEPEDELIIGHVRYVQFTGGKMDLMFDFCATGVWGLFSSTPAKAYKAHLKREGNKYVWIMPNNRVRFGTRLADKIIVRPGRHNMDEIHVINRLHYQWPRPALVRVQFTNGKAVEGFAITKNADYTGFNRNFDPWLLDNYKDDARMGWVRLPNNAEAVSPDKQEFLGPIFSGGIKGTGKAVFRVEHPNCYCITNVMFSGQKGPSQAVVKVNNSKEYPVNIGRGQRDTVLVPTKVTDGRIDVQIDGSEWMISGIVVNFLLGEKEDYQWSRGWWAFGKTPWQFAEYKDKKPWNVWPIEMFEQKQWDY